MYLTLCLSLRLYGKKEEETTKRELYVGLHVHVIKANVSFYWTLFLKFDWNNEFTLISLEYQVM